MLITRGTLVGGLPTLEVTALVGFAFAVHEGHVVEPHPNVGSAMTSDAASTTWKQSPATSVSYQLRVGDCNWHGSNAEFKGVRRMANYNHRRGIRITVLC
jgi:hypothetical protein